MPQSDIGKDICFSIIMPTYNRASSIGRAIQSILVQDYHNFELIIVDDGSTDKTKEIVTRFQDIRIKYFYKENEERNFARNYGIARASGNYIGFLDSDDFFYQNHFSTAHDTIRKYGCKEVFHFGYNYVNHEELINKKVNSLPPDISELLIKKNILSCNGILIRRDITDELKFFPSKDAIVGEDHWLWLKLISRYGIHINNTITSAIVEHVNRSIKSPNPNKLKKGLNELLDDLLHDPYFLKKYSKSIPSFLAQRYLLIALYSLSAGESVVARIYINKSINLKLTSILSKRGLAAVKNLILAKYAK